MGPIDIAPADLETVRAILRKHVPDRRVIAFGSRATWTAKQFSDLDLAVMGDAPLPSAVRAALAEEFDESDLPFKVDVVDWTTTSEKFRSVVQRDAMVLQEARWGLTRLADLGSIVTGKTPPTADDHNYGGDVPFITPSDMDGRRYIDSTARCLTERGADTVRAARIPAGAVLVSCIGSDMGKAAIALRSSVTNQQINSVIVAPPNVPLFVFYDLSRRRLEIRQAAGGSAQPILNKSAFGNLPIHLPRPETQAAIAHVLGALDDRIELNRRTNETLEAMARALFRSWFVDFDPVRAKAEGRRPSGMDAETAKLFPERLAETEAGESPEGWHRRHLGELLELRTDRVDATPAKDGARYVALEDMPTRSIDLSRYQPGSAVNSSIIAFRQGDILFGAMRPYFHKVGMAFFDGITRTTTLVLRPRDEAWRHFALMHFSSDEAVSFATTASVGTTIPYVKWESLAAYSVPLPPRELAARFTSIATPFTQRIAHQGEESRLLAQVRDVLLPRLLAGDLDVESWRSKSQESH